MKKRTGIAVIALVALSGPAGAMADAPRDPTHAAITHLATGFRFPAAVGPFNRVSINAFNSAATNISIGYASLTPGSQVAVTVYITPAPAVADGGQAQSCDKQFEAMDRRFNAVHPGARQLVRGDVRSPSPTYAGSGRQVIYDYEDVFYGQRQTLRSETNLFCYVGGNWLIAYRSTAPVKVDYAPKLANFMRSLAWPVPGSGRPVAEVAPAPPRPVAAVTPAPPRPVAVVAPASPQPVAVAAASRAQGNRVIVRVKANRDRAAVAGLVATGSEADLARFEAAASQRGVDARRMTENGKSQSIASLLKPEITLANATDLFRSTRDGKFGKIKLEVLLIPADVTGEERDLLSRAPIYPVTVLENF